GLIILAVTAGIALLMNAILLPIMFKFGVEKGRYILMLIVFTPMLLFTFFMNRSNVDPIFFENFIPILTFAFPLVVIAAFTASRLISVKIMEMKEM
ncbi:MAG TPA: ABC-2 transporter permease, partial [Bacillota bacterium]|nr:ABC-2 transporter permease [Bacillota bacterium]